MFQKLTDTSYAVSAWSGGTTTQLAIIPPEAKYADRDFLWRVSSATVDLEESDFTALPDYDRLIATLQGEIVLTHNGGVPIKLHPFEVHAFSGADATHSRGRCTDFNLMLRRGRAAGTMEALRLTDAPTNLSVGTSIACPQTSPASRGGGAPQRGAEEGYLPPEVPTAPAVGTSIACPPNASEETLLLYCAEGSCTATVGAVETSPASRGGGAPQRGAEEGCCPQPAAAIPVSLRAGEALLLTDLMPLTLSGPATLMLCRITAL